MAKETEKTVRTKDDIVKLVAARIRERRDLLDSDIHKLEVKAVIDEFVAACRQIVLDGDSLVIRDFISMSLEDRRPKTVYSSFGGQQVRHTVGPSKSIKITPAKSLVKAVRERYNRTVETPGQDKPATNNP